MSKPLRRPEKEYLVIIYEQLINNLISVIRELRVVVNSQTAYSILAKGAGASW